MHFLLEKILEKPELFEFFQAVRLINLVRIDQDKRPIQKRIRFKSFPSFIFPISDIAQANLDNTGAVELQMSFGGLYGAHGLLPLHYNELLIKRLQAKDTSLRDFLDKFNQYVMPLFYQAWKKQHFYIGYEQAKRQNEQSDHFTHLLSCLIGQGVSVPKERLHVSAENFLFYGGAFASQQRSAHRLQNVLSDYFGICIKTVQFKAKWIWLASKNRTRIGKHHNQLGINMILGTRMWDCQNHFRLQLGPLNYAQFQMFLPGAVKLKILLQLTNLYICMGLSFDVQLLLEGKEVPAFKLDKRIRLGYDSWLKSKKFNQPVGDAIISWDEKNYYVNDQFKTTC